MKSVERNGHLAVALLLFAVSALTPAAMAAVVQTDKADYAPDEVVVITGSGFDTNTIITVGVAGPDGWFGQGEDGEADTDIFNSAQIPEWVLSWEPVGSDGFIIEYYKGLCGGEFYLYVQDEAGNSADTTFTDGPLVYSPTRYPASAEQEVVQGGSLSFTLTITADSGTNKVYQPGPYDSISGYSELPTSWLSYSPGSLILSTGDTGSTQVTITVPSAATPGVYAKKMKFNPTSTPASSPGNGVIVYINVTSAGANAPPTAAFTWSPEQADEGSEVTFTDGSTDTDGTIDSWSWNFGDGGTSIDQNPRHTYADNGTYAVTLTVTDDDDESDSITQYITVSNVAPAVGSIAISPPEAVVAVGAKIDASADFTDPGILDTHTAEWDWGDATSAGTVTETNGSGSVSDSHTYTSAGIYTVGLTVTDKDGGSGTNQYQYVVVYDPSAGFVTGGGWIMSPEGAYADDPSLTGKANFGFVAKYKKGANVPDGNTEFQFKAGNLNFHSTSYDWLVVTGSNYARFKGVGTINGGEEYKFMLWAGDGGDTGDTFRIRIWWEDTTATEHVVYDNGAEQVIDGGSIVVHAK